MKTNRFKTTKELIKFVKEFEDKRGTVSRALTPSMLDIDYFKLTATLRTKHENRTIDQESDKYIDKELGTIDSITDMKRAENLQHPSKSKWMTRKPKTMTVK